MFPIKRLCVSDEPSQVVPQYVKTGMIIALYILSALSESMEERIFRNRLTFPAAFW